MASSKIECNEGNISAAYAKEVTNIHQCVSLLFPLPSILHDSCILSRESKARMIIPKIINIRPSKSVVSFSSISLPILPQNTSEKNDTA